MLTHTALKALVLTFILTLGSLLPALLIPQAYAETTQGYTTLYFTNALGSFDTSDLFTYVTLTPPAKQNDSKYPPSFLAQNIKLGKNSSVISEQWITWLTIAWVGQLLGNSSEFNLSDLGGFGGLALFFPGPYRVVEGYTYNGNDAVNIKGDIIYHLFFSDTKKNKKLTDSVNVGLYSINMNSEVPLPRLIKNTTVKLSPPNILGGIYDQQITLPNTNFTLVPGDSLLFSIEIVPTEKHMPVFNFFSLNITKKFGEFIVNRWENKTLGPIRKKIGAIIKNVTSLIEESGVNLTSDDVASLINAVKSSKFIYDSIQHPSSVIIPAKISEEDIRDYFLHANQGMDENRPTSDNSTGKVALNTTPAIWKTKALDRNRILKINNITASLYLNKADFYRFLDFLQQNLSVIATIYDGNTTIASSQQRIDKALIAYLQKSQNPLMLSFTGKDYEIPSGHQLALGVSLNKDPLFHKIRKINLQYDGINVPSFLRIKYEETKNIQIHNVTETPADGKIIPGGSVNYVVTVSSLKSDTFHISTIEREKIGNWTISSPQTITIPANSTVQIPVFVNSTDNIKAAYGNTIDLIINVIGSTGIARTEITAEVSKDAIHYKVEILGYSTTINVSKGESHTFYFIIKNNNTGAVDDVDSYTVTATSEHNWHLVPRDSIKNVKKGATTDPTTARVFIEAPKNTTATTDEITITVTSDGNSDATATITITVHVASGGLLEELVNIFNSAAKSLGLNDLFGDYGGFVLFSIIIVIILFILIILALVLTTKPVRLICTDRIKEIEANEQATYDINLQNRQKSPQTYDINADHTAPAGKWIITIDPLTVAIDGRQTNTVHITMTPTEQAQPGDWTQITVRVKKTGKTKTEHLTLMTMIKEGKTLLQLGNVTHWPVEFTPGEKVTTSFSIANKGTVTARNVTVFFYLNGRQKNKLTVTIPADGAADIQIPWIATKGKNQMRIRLKEL